ncbi:RICIN domain-containing protein [Mucilaginibacter sp. BJC16-A38]|uniref:RICIN domain-containing protein n=1 Tax=Mucilaginibacter phenanthrenivorans TaxID=1234842 RepID=UPI0021575C1F|nr:RICIN domain-containing protein [Mucilaginibacter phenanthrenivorans]MCR8557767.1 RICIN domain-containing protein [Mucilaginibacter phenanthrenivorans]
MTGRTFFFILCAGFFLISCKKEAAQKSTTSVVTTDTTTTIAGTLPFVPADSLRGVNWACDGDNFSDGILVLSGLTSADSYATVRAKATVILSGIQANTGANTVRIPVNYFTVSTSWWNAYAGVIDAATGKGMNVILGCWEGVAAKDGKIDNVDQFFSMWQIIVKKYSSNPHVFFEIFNEPHGYSLSDWAAICANWLNKNPAASQTHVLVDGTSYAQDITGVGADSRLTKCLLSIHDYAFFSDGSLKTAAQWENRLKTNVGSYGSRAVLTEFGDVMNNGTDYTGAINGSADIASILGLTNEVRALGMGSVYWPGIRTGDSYAIQSLGGTAASPTVIVTNASGISRLKYAWGIGAGGTDVFYTGAYYRLLNLNSGDAMDVNGSSTLTGASVIQWPQNGGNNQQWIITDNGGGYYKITNRNSGYALDVNGASTATGTPVIQSAWVGGNNQQWQLTKVSTGVYKVTNRNSGLTLDVTGASTTSGAALIQSTWSSVTNQQWQIVQQ